MESYILEFTVKYIRENASHKKPIKNQDLDEALQESLGLKPLGDGAIRALIHECRLNIDIITDSGDVGWLCANHNGYFVSFNASAMNESLMSFFSKITKMMKVYQKGMQVLNQKTYYKQRKLFDYGEGNI